MANAAEAFAADGFGMANLPYGSVKTDDGAFLAVRLGSRAINLGELVGESEELSAQERGAVKHPNLDLLLQLNSDSWRSVRAAIVNALQADGSAERVEQSSVEVDSAEYLLPFTPADYVDFYASENHASNIGKMFRPDEEPLKPNWKHLPVGYHGRAGTVVVSGTDIVRPQGLRPGADGPTFGPSQRLDIEAEMGFVCGGAPVGTAVKVADAEEYIFGAFLFNDWSARDIQAFEYVPLGPNLGKSFASTAGSWVVPFEALRAARVEPPKRDFELADYLKDGSEEGGPWGLDITMEVVINGGPVSHPEYSTMYWTPPQMLAHMTINGGSLRPGDIYASGTVSGPERGQRGSFMELAWGGQEPLTLEDGTEMVFLQDGQEVVLRASAPAENGEVIDFGDCAGKILPSSPQ